MNATGTFWTILFSTGEHGSRFTTRKAAERYADDANRYSERAQGERVVRAVVRYVRFERTTDFSV
jgi:hypothetical protein